MGGTVEDSKLYFSELVHRDLSKWRRCAIVTDHDWLRHAISVFRFMMPGEVECFGSSQVQAAVDWARPDGDAIARPARRPAGQERGARRRPRYVLTKRNAAATSGSRMAPTTR